MTGIPWQARWSRAQIHAIVREQYEAFIRRPTGVRREQLDAVLQAADAPLAVIVSGLRRAGKSTLLAQAARQLGEASFYYISFDDERFLGFQAEDAGVLLTALAEVFGERHIFVLDEVQNVAGWERFARRWMDQGYKLYITGSNAALLSRELGTRLTGRYVPVALYPFSFAEYCAWRGVVPLSKARTTLERAQLNRELDGYVRAGGIPEALQYPQLPLLRTLYDDVIYRDIATRHRIDEVRVLRELAFQLMSNPAGLVSYNKLRQQLGLGSVTTVKNYTQYLEDSWLLLTANVYDASVKRQQIAPKKVFAIDTGLVNAVGFQTSPNAGHLLENVVYLALRRNTQRVYYYTTRAGHEVDAYLPEQRLFVQVTQHLANLAVYEREMRALQEATAEVAGSRGLLLCMDAGVAPQPAPARIEIRDLATWLLEGPAP